MRRRPMLWALLICLGAPAAAQEGGGEPSALACNDFKLEVAAALARSPDSLQVNNLLFEAARKGCVSALETLRAAGASLLARDRMGNVALAIAARSGRLAFAKALLAAATPDEAGQLDRPNVAGSTPLIQAVQADRAALARWLVESGAKVDVANGQGETALSVAAFKADADLAQLLLTHGAAPDTIDATGKGVMIYAAARGSTRIVEMLLGAGVDPNKRYRADVTALMWAAGHPDNVAEADGLETVRFLLAHGAKVDLLDDRGRSALMIAAERNHVEIAKVLLAAGADRALRDKTGKSAADLAGHTEVRAVVE